MQQTEDRMVTEGPAWWRQSRFPLFLTSRTLSFTGDRAAITALTLHIYAQTGSGVAVSGLFVIRVLPRLFGAWAGAFGDRMELRRLLVVCEIVSGLLVLALAGWRPGYFALLLMVLIIESVATVAMPASESTVARSIPPFARARANGAILAAEAFSFAGGAAVGSLSIKLWGYQYALIIDAATFFVSAGLLSFIRRVPPEPRAEGETGNFFASTMVGLRALRQDRRLAAIVIAIIGVTFAAAIDRPALVVLVAKDLDPSGLGYGLALGGISVGALLATLLTGRLRWLPVTIGVVVAGILVEGLGHLAMGLAPAVAWLVVAGAVAGFGNGVEAVAGVTLLQLAAPAATIGLLMGVVMSGSYIADAIGSVCGGGLLSLMGPVWLFVIAAILMVICGVIAVAGRGPTAGTPEPNTEVG